jgi:tetratricopeptide (TPR) repeat protein
MRKWLLPTALLALIVGPSSAHADLIELSNGQKISGSISRQGEVVTIKSDDGRTITAKPDEIRRVTLTGSISPAEAAGAEWTRVSQQIRVADDLHTILALHTGYLDKYPQAPNAAEVRTSFGVYQRLAENDAVKFRGRWVTKAQIDVIVRGWADAARPAVEHYKAGRYKDAFDAAKAAIDADKDNPNALTVAGLAAYRAGNLGAARSYFTALAAADPANPLAENNIAVIAFQQKQASEGIAHFSKALQIAPDQRVVLDNIIEAVGIYLGAGGDRTTTTLKNLQRHFDAAEKRMEEAMAKQGLVRRGSTWVTKEQADRQAADFQALQAQYAQLETQYVAAKAAVAQYDNLIRQADADYNAALVSILIMNEQIIAAQRDGNGTLMLHLLASRDLTVANANRLEVVKSQYLVQRDQVIASSRDIFAQADRLQAAMVASTVRLTGTLQIIDLAEAEKSPATGTAR